MMRLPPLLILFAVAACGGSSGGGGASPDADATAGEGVWLKGDLHLHSHHSDDASDNRMTEIVSEAEQRGMDYFLVTDHDNHVDGALETWDDPAYRSESMVILYGAEWTTDKGHANFVAAEPYDHLALYRMRNGDIDRITKLAHRMGVHVSPSHPTTGDPWLYGFDGVDSVEVWNALFKFPSDNREALNLWDELLKGGHRIAARGGSDCHHQEGIEPLGVNVGTPTTWVHAHERSGAAIVDALDAGHATISYAPAAERVVLRADADGDGRHEMLMGDNAAPPGSAVDFRVTIEGYRPLGTYNLRVIRNGELLREISPDGANVEFSDTPPAGERSYYRVELKGSTPEAETLPAQAVGFYGRMVAVTNPIYFGFER